MLGIALSSITAIQAQVGINTEDPKTTLDVTINAQSGIAPGITAPRLSGDELKALDGKYAAAQIGAMVYVTAAVGTASAKTANVTAAGYYYFDGSIWQIIKSGGSGSGSGTITADNGLSISNDDVQLGGKLLQDTEIDQDGKDFYTTGDGKMSIGAAPTAGSAKFEVNGASANTQAHDAGNGNGIDFTQSNLAYTTASAGVFVPYGIKDGGTYTLAVKGTTSGTASFMLPGMTFHYVNNGATTAGKHTLYTFIVMGNDAYVWMTKGF
ncbi:hypothetical protein FACS189429_0620 [Bacteroidia bacterium]|nr:hypothetical protein FACS189429_0620 [Bacteroidia bacterium]